MSDREQADVQGVSLTIEQLSGQWYVLFGRQEIGVDTTRQKAAAAAVTRLELALDLLQGGPSIARPTSTTTESETSQ